MKGYSRLARLIFLYLRKELNWSQERELKNWRESSDFNEYFFQQETSMDRVRNRFQAHEESSVRIYKKLENEFPEGWKDGPPPNPALIIRLLKSAAIVAGGLIITGIVALGINMYMTSHSSGPLAMVVTINGQREELDDAKLGLWAGFHGIDVEKKEGGNLLYRIPENAKAGKEQRDTLWTAGSWQIEMRLAEGSDIWMNVSGWIAYPQNFAKADTVSYYLSGEGYFNIPGKSSKNYVIRTDSMMIQATGAELDVKSNTVFGGPGVLMVSGNASVTPLYQTDSTTRIINLNPGQMLRLVQGKLIVEDHPDVKAILQWKK